jgi:inorganic triphosphatase YgiF
MSRFALRVKIAAIPLVRPDCPNGCDYPRFHSKGAASVRAQRGLCLGCRRIIPPHGGIAALSYASRDSEHEPAAQRLDSVYFDTPKLKLRDHGLTFRVRRSGKRHLQTIKATEKGTNGAFGRGESEQQISGNRPVLELGVDRGQIRRYGRPESEPISEIEIEVKAGDRLEPSMLAERLARSVAVAYDPVSKAERGPACRSSGSDEPVAAGLMRPREAAGRALAAKELAQLLLRGVQGPAPLGRESFAAAVDLEVEHGHRGLEGGRFAPVARLRRALEREGDGACAALPEYPCLQIQRITAARHLG